MSKYQENQRIIDSVLKSDPNFFEEMTDPKKYKKELLRKLEHIPNKEFHCARLALESDCEVDRFLQNLLNYLRKIKPGNLSEEFVFNQIFQTKWGHGENGNITKAHVAAMEASLARLNLIFKQNPNEVLKELLIDFVCDAKRWIENIDSTQDFNWIIFNTNRAVSHGYFYMVRNSLYGIDGNKFRQYDAQFVVATLQIRNTIETRVKQLLGIAEFKYKNKFTEKSVEFATIIKILKKVKCLNSKEVSFYRLETINKWANNHLHKGLRPYPWQLEWAELEIRKLFYIGECSDNKTFSIYAAFETENIAILRSEFEEESLQFFSQKNKEVKDSDIQILWMSHGEIFEQHKSI